MNAVMRMRSMTAPDMIDAVVQANSVNAPQKTPVALSSRFGPMFSPQGTPPAPASKSGVKPWYIAR